MTTEALSAENRAMLEGLRDELAMATENPRHSIRKRWSEQQCQDCRLALSDMIVGRTPPPIGGEGVDARAIVQAEYDHWIKEALKHKRPGGYRSDCAESDLERAKVAKRIIDKLSALTTPNKGTACEHGVRWPWACDDCDLATPPPEHLVSGGVEKLSDEPLTVETAAIRIGEAVFTLPRPNRHHNVMWWLSTLGIRSGQMHDQGFVLSDGSFVGRVKAATLALENGQVQTLHAPPNLYSEDLWDGGFDMAMPDTLTMLAEGNPWLNTFTSPPNPDTAPPPSTTGTGGTDSVEAMLREALKPFAALAHQMPDVFPELTSDLGKVVGCAFSNGFLTGRDFRRAHDVLATQPPSREGAESGWRDIASAPRDGTSILIFVPAHKSWSATVAISDYYEQGSCFLIDGVGVFPTHWQPLPPPPTSEEKP